MEADQIKMDWIISNQIGFVVDYKKEFVEACVVDKVSNDTINLHSMLSNNDYIKSIKDISITLFHDFDEAEEHLEQELCSLRERNYWSEFFGVDFHL